MGEGIKTAAISVNGWLGKILPSLVVATILGGFTGYVTHNRAIASLQEQRTADRERLQKLEAQTQQDRDLVTRVAVVERLVQEVLFELRQSRRASALAE